MTKPVARISYNVTYENFMDDENYTRQIKLEQEQARRAAEDLLRRQEKVRLDSLNKLWNDSLARFKTNESQLTAQRAEQERLRREQEKARTLVRTGFPAVTRWSLRSTPARRLPRWLSRRERAL